MTFSTTATDTLASPWVDYQTDKAFVGGDDGKIYRISCVFNCALNTNPTVDWTFTLPVAGTGGAAARPNGPVYDYPSGRLFVGDQLGELWVINAGGASADPQRGSGDDRRRGLHYDQSARSHGNSSSMHRERRIVWNSRFRHHGQLRRQPANFCFLRQ